MSESVLRGTSSSERTLDARELMSWRPAAPATQRKRNVSQPRRKVTSGIVCFCGERFAEAQALEFMLHLRAEIGSDLAIQDRRRAYERRRNQDPARKALKREYDRQRRLNDPAVRERQRQRDRERYARKKAEREGSL